MKKNKQIMIFLGIFLGIIFSYFSFQNYFSEHSEKTISKRDMVSENISTISSLSGNTAEATGMLEDFRKVMKLEAYPVVQVVDGDTIKVLIQGKKTTVRVLGIDTPEIYTTRTGYQECYGKEASEFAKKLLEGVSVQLEMDPTQDQKDKYGRLLAHVFFSGGLYYEEQSIKNGYGFKYVYRTPTKYDDLLQQAEIEAKDKQLGVWDKCGGIRKPIKK